MTKSYAILLLSLMIIFYACSDNITEDNEENIESLSEIIKPGIYDVQMAVDTLDRWFKVIVPSGYDHSEARPLLLAYHGGNLSMGFMFNNRKDIIERCERENWILVFTNGANFDGNRGSATWNAVHCCPPAWTFNVDDVGYTKKIIETLSDNLKIDAKKIYAIGGSNGAMLVHRLAAEIPEIFAAVAENQGTVGGKRAAFDPIIKVQPKVPIPFILIHGANDQSVKFQGGLSIDQSRWDLSFEESVNLWANNNQCNILTADTSIIEGLEGKVWIVDFKDCQSNAPIRAIAIENNQLFVSGVFDEEVFFSDNTYYSNGFFDYFLINKYCYY